MNTNELAKQKQALDLENFFCFPAYGYQREKGGGINQEFRTSRHKLLYITQRNNKDLLYSTVSNYTQYLIINYDGKECEEYIHICDITESPHYTPEMNSGL